MRKRKFLLFYLTIFTLQPFIWTIGSLKEKKDSSSQKNENQLVLQTIKRPEVLESFGFSEPIIIVWLKTC
ncbi:hypothetical protein HCUR_00528 [Holospora curviuscula]|uniref:Uncharacterized protein n=1 Tax=Holospora curviuscula TaxID=1082868 RepID=A0A2S5R9L9_9PROT|nr:hypothetical protein HCUR_00528 [Holospora curviuscula]